ncbi:hypothetical protein Tco_0211786 [Tanacetum coccineum]
MATGALSHSEDNTGILTYFSNSSMYPSVYVGNGHSIPVTHTGHSFLHTSSKPLHLNHILVTPHIIKNLISVRQFTRDNDVFVEFDAYGFSVKDYQTGRLLLRCDSTGDLYPVTQQPSSQTPVVLLSFSFTTWHRRLGHPGDDVLRRKHAKLPFYNFESSVDSVFEIIHSDLWMICSHWSELTKGRTRWKQTNTQRTGFYTENKQKEEHSLPKSRIASLAIRVPFIDPTAKNENPMIEDIQWSRSKAQGERVRSLEASLPAYKYKASSLTEDHHLFFFSF